jgi:hypothetical protein
MQNSGTKMTILSKTKEMQTRQREFLLQNRILDQQQTDVDD